MDGLPQQFPTQGQEVFTGLVCPDCSGNLVVSAQQDHVSFHCRVGHTYGIVELVLAKESALESAVWRTVFAFEELAAMLTDLDSHGLAEWCGPDNCRARSELAQEQAKRLRAVIEIDRPLTERSPGNGEIRMGPS